jgi:hypothetical protein
LTSGETVMDLALRETILPARAQERLVVVLPGGAGQGEEPLPLQKRDGGVRVRVEQDVAVVEGGEQPDLVGQEHAVAEDVARHVADADHGEGIDRRVLAELAEVPLDGFPGTPGGDAHALVVVAGGAARGEGIVEPEAVGPADVVGDVGEGRRALVGGNDEVGVVVVVADHVLGRDHFTLDLVVGDVQQAREEQAVAADRLVDLGLAVAAFGRALDEEAALRPHGHDDPVLDHLRLHQAQDLGAEVLAPVGPAQAATGDLAAPEMHALDRGRIDEDLEGRARQRHVRHARRIELERKVGLWRALGAALEGVGPQGRLDQAEIAAKDPVLVEDGHGLQALPDPLFKRFGLGRAVAGEAGIESGIEQGDEVGREPWVRGEGVLDIALAEG